MRCDVAGNASHFRPRSPHRYPQTYPHTQHPKLYISKRSARVCEFPRPLEQPLQGGFDEAHLHVHPAAGHRHPCDAGERLRRHRPCPCPRQPHLRRRARHRRLAREARDRLTITPTSPTSCRHLATCERGSSRGSTRTPGTPPALLHTTYRCRYTTRSSHPPAAHLEPRFYFYNLPFSFLVLVARPCTHGVFHASCTCRERESARWHAPRRARMSS